MKMRSFFMQVSSRHIFSLLERATFVGWNLAWVTALFFRRLARISRFCNPRYIPFFQTPHNSSKLSLLLSSNFYFFIFYQLCRPFHSYISILSILPVFIFFRTVPSCCLSFFTIIRFCDCSLQKVFPSRSSKKITRCLTPCTVVQDSIYGLLLPKDVIAIWKASFLFLLECQFSF